MRKMNAERFSKGKTTLVLSLLAAMLLTAGCADGNKQNTPDGKPNGEDGTVSPRVYPALSSVAETLMAEYTFPEMYELPEDQIEGEFGVSLDDFSDIYAATTVEYPGIERIFLGVAKDDASLEDAKDDLAAYFEMLKKEYVDYIPSEYKKAKNLDVYTDDDFLCLVVCDDGKEALNCVKKAVSAES